jgi:hypothetical protein
MREASEEVGVDIDPADLPLTAGDAAIRGWRPGWRGGTCMDVHRGSPLRG